MNLAFTASLVFTSLLLFCEHSPAQPTTYHLKGCGTQGSGALVSNVPGIDGVAIMTALHVLSQCKNKPHALIEIRQTTERALDLNSPTSFKLRPETPVYAHPGLDVAFVPITDVGLTAGSALQGSPRELALRTSVLIRGLDSVNPKPVGIGDYRYHVSVEALRDYFADQGIYDSLGSLSNASTLLVYQSTGAPGNSGAGVYLEDGTLVGMHQGGGSGSYVSTTWAVQVSRQDIDEQGLPKKYRLQDLPASRAPVYGHSVVNDYAAHRTASDLYPDGPIWTITAAAHIEPAHAFLGGRLDVGYVKPFYVTRHFMVGAALGLALIGGTQDRSFFSPSGNRPLEEDRQGTLGGDARAGIGLLFHRTFDIQSLLVLAYDAQPRHSVASPTGDFELDFAHGPTAQLNVCLSPLSGACLQGGFMLAMGHHSGNFTYSLASSAVPRAESEAWTTFTAGFAWQWKDWL